MTRAASPTAALLARSCRTIVLVTRRQREQQEKTAHHDRGNAGLQQRRQLKIAHIVLSGEACGPSDDAQQQAAQSSGTSQQQQKSIHAYPQLFSKKSWSYCCLGTGSGASATDVTCLEEAGKETRPARIVSESRAGTNTVPVADNNSRVSLCYTAICGERLAQRGLPSLSVAGAPATARRQMKGDAGGLLRHAGYGHQRRTP